MFYIIFAFVAFLLSFTLTPLIIKICDKKNIYDAVDERKIHSGNIPRLGGIAIFTSFILVTLFYNLSNPYFDITEYWQVIVAFLIIFLTGVIDDFFDLKAKLKFLLQIVAAVLVATSPFYFSHFLDLHLPSIIGRGAIFFWILLCVNAYNMIDGMDLVCSGISSISILAFGVCGFFEGWNLYPILFILFASLLGFMFWNKPNAKIFLGDSGSTTLGFLLAVIPVLDSANTTFQFNNLFTCIYIAAIPTIDLFAAIIRRLRDNVGIFSADRAHLHHKLLNIGLTKNKAIFCVLSIQFYISIVLLLPIFINTKYSSMTNFLAYLVVIGLFIFIHYINLQVNLYNDGIFDNCSFEYSKKIKAENYLKFIKVPEEGEVCSTNFSKSVFVFVKRLIFIFVLTFGWLISCKPTLEYLPMFPNAKIVYSILYFAILGFSLAIWFSKKDWQEKLAKTFIICVLILGLYCFIDELHQFFVLNRHASLIDVLFDFIGVIIGIFVGGSFQRFSKFNF